MFILDDVKNDKILKDSENLFKQYYRDDSPQGYSLERLNIGFRALQGGLTYENTAKLMESSLDNERLDVVAEAFTEKRSSEEIKLLYTSDGRTPNSAEKMRNIKRGYDANLVVSELKTVVNDYYDDQFKNYVICRENGLSVDDSKVVSDFGKYHIDDAITLVKSGVSIDDFVGIRDNLQQSFDDFYTYGYTHGVGYVLEQLVQYRTENNLSGHDLVLATTPNPYADYYDKVPGPARVKSIANGIIAGVPEDKLLEIIQSARTTDELSDLIEVAAFVQEIDFLTEQVNDSGLQM